MIFELGRGQSNWGQRYAPRICWVRWNGQHSKNCVSLSSCRKTKSQKKLINISYLNKRKSSMFGDSYTYEHFTYPYYGCIKKRLCNRIYIARKKGEHELDNYGDCTVAVIQQVKNIEKKKGKEILISAHNNNIRRNMTTGNKQTIYGIKHVYERFSRQTGCLVH